MRTKDGKEVKITRVGRLYIDGVLTPTMSDGRLVGDRITPLNLPDRHAVGAEVWSYARDWAYKNYRMV